MKHSRLRPILWTKNLNETIRFYVNLGFDCRYQIERFAALTKDAIEIMIVVPEDDPGDCKEDDNKEAFFPKPYFTGSIYMDVDNVDEYWEKMKDKVNVKYAIGNQEWNVRGFSIYDNNGYELVFGQNIGKS